MAHFHRQLRPTGPSTIALPQVRTTVGSCSGPGPSAPEGLASMRRAVSRVAVGWSQEVREVPLVRPRGQRSLAAEGVGGHRGRGRKTIL